MKLFPNFTSIPFDYLLRSLVTNYVSKLGFLTCLSWIVLIENSNSLKCLDLKFCLTLWSTSVFRVGPLAVFFVHFPLRWYCKISWSILSLLYWWYTAIFIFWNVIAWGFSNRGRSGRRDWTEWPIEGRRDKRSLPSKNDRQSNLLHHQLHNWHLNT